VDKEPKVRLDL